MDVNPLEAAPAEKDSPATQGARDQAHARLNTWVAIAVAFIATFMGICTVKDGNIVQAMQQAQADKIDLWNFYQARHVRAEVMTATAAQMEALRDASPKATTGVFDRVARSYRDLSKSQTEKMEGVKHDAEAAQAKYDALNYRDDQFDLEEALLAISISLLAITSLTRQRWLFWVAMVPTGLGLLMGLAGLIGLKIHSDFVASLLS